MTKDEVADTLGLLCRWHRRLCDLVDMVASCYELPLFVVIAYCFANSVFGVYLVITFRGPDSLLRITGVIWSVAYGCRLILIAVIPSVTVAQVSGGLMSASLCWFMSKNYFSAVNKKIDFFKIFSLLYQLFVTQNFLII